MKQGGDRKSDQSAKTRDDQVSLSRAASLMRVGKRAINEVRKVRREAPEKIKAITNSRKIENNGKN